MKWLLSASVVIVVALAWWLIRPLVAGDATQGSLQLLALVAGLTAGAGALTTWLLCDEAD